MCTVVQYCLDKYLMFSIKILNLITVFYLFTYFKLYYKNFKLKYLIWPVSFHITDVNFQICVSKYEFVHPSQIWHAPFSKTNYFISLQRDHTWLPTIVTSAAATYKWISKILTNMYNVFIIRIIFMCVGNAVS